MVHRLDKIINDCAAAFNDSGAMMHRFAAIVLSDDAMMHRKGEMILSDEGFMLQKKPSGFRPGRQCNFFASSVLLICNPTEQDCFKLHCTKHTNHKHLPDCKTRKYEQQSINNCKKSISTSFLF
ncbi:MAG: hypothetical protein Q8861_10825 [Bacteroidota bacterium]|nr:hypothetical protein [Bacteroidota bacterium]